MKFVINGGPHHGFGIVSAIIPLLVVSVITIALLFIIIMLFRGTQKSMYNSAAAVLTVNARMVAKRGHMHNNYTRYYATFQVESGDRLEFGVDGRQFGLLAEGDEGRLTFQGERYLGFEHLSINPQAGRYNG